MEHFTNLRLPEGYQVNLSDFALFQSVMKNKTALECVLGIFLEEEDLKLIDAKVEQIFLNKKGLRSIRLDAWAMDSKHRQFNTEMQNDILKDNLKKRARFYQGLMDSPVLKSGKETKYKNLPETTIFFITQEDLFGRNQAKYSFTEQCEELNDLRLEDGTKKVFLNMKSKNGKPELISLLQYMKDTRLDNPEIIIMDKRILTLHQIVEETRQSEEWEDVKMTLLEFGVQKGFEQGLTKGMEKGMEKGKAEFVLELLEDLGTVPDPLRTAILTQTDLATLSSWLKLAAKADSIESFKKAMN